MYARPQTHRSPLTLSSGQHHASSHSSFFQGASYQTPPPPAASICPETLTPGLTTHFLSPVLS